SLGLITNLAPRPRDEHRRSNAYGRHPLPKVLDGMTDLDERRLELGQFDLGASLVKVGEECFGEAVRALDDCAAQASKLRGALARGCPRDLPPRRLLRGEQPLDDVASAFRQIDGGPSAWRSSLCSLLRHLRLHPRRSSASASRR